MRKHLRRAVTIAVVVISAGAGAQTTYSPNPPYPGAAEQQTPKSPLLLALVIEPLLQQSGASLAAGVGSLFSRLFSALTGHGGTHGAASAGAGLGTGYAGSSATGSYGGWPNPPSTTDGYPAAPAYPGATGYTGATGSTYPSGATSSGQGGYPSYPAPSAYSGTAGPSYPAPSAYPYPGTAGPFYPAPSPSPGTVGASSPPSGYPGANTNGGDTTGSWGTQNPAAAAAPSNPASQTYPLGQSYGGPAVSDSASYPSQAGAGAAPPLSKTASVPSVILSVNRLDPQTYASVGVIEVAHGTPTLRTGDVFALEYATNVPGQLRIDNIDSRGQMTPLGTYTVLAGRDNRIPHTKGIKLTGTTGVEIFRLYFFPCNPSETGGDAPAAAAGLPACSAAPNPQLLQAAKGLVVAKGAVNLESPDPTIAVSAAADYQPNDITQTEFRINHTDAG